MKKLVYILFVFVAVLAFNSCSKDKVVANAAFDPFAVEDDQNRGLVSHDDITGGGVIDNDDDDDDKDADNDEEGGGVIDNDDDDDDKDADNDETIVDDRDDNQGL